MGACLVVWGVCVCQRAATSESFRCLSHVPQAVTNSTSNAIAAATASSRGGGARIVACKCRMVGGDLTLSMSWFH